MPSFIMPQLVGESCAICQQRISATYDARFCAACGNPVHDRCCKAPAESDREQRCSVCSGDLASAAAARFKTVRAKQAAKAGAKKYLVSQVCPACGQACFTTAKPSTRVAFRLDRVCTDCGTRYIPPTPRWASVTFILAGLALLAAAPLFGLTVGFFGGGLAFVLVSVPLILAGAMAVLHGLRTLAETNQQNGFKP
jgi:hypothetical protein